MGNSSTKEARGQSGPNHQNDSAVTNLTSARDAAERPEPPTRPSYGRQQRRGSRPDFSFLGIGGSAEGDTAALEARRESKLEREAKKAEREKQARLRERERSMQEEHVDGGYLVTQGVYVGVEDFHKAMVRQLTIERRLAPFWRGLNDFSESWAEHQLMAAARGMPIPPADQVPPELEYTLTKRPSGDANKSKSMTIPIHSRSPSFQSDHSLPQSPVLNTGSIPSLPAQGSYSSANPFRARAKTLASLTSSRNEEQKSTGPREYQLPPDPFVNGQPIEVYLYKDACECPICFLYYPPYLNTTRCCEQQICSECFVQIKRPDPHPPEHEQPDPNAPPMSEEEKQAQAEGLLVSEVATCPYCKTPEFGITYTPPTFRRGLTYGLGPTPYQVKSAMSSETSLASGQLSPGSGRRRGTSLSANAPEVITTDKIRPDWATKLATARAHAARRSAAASALHAAAYLMNGQGDRAAFTGFGRRNMLRRSTLEGERATEAQIDAMASFVEQRSAMQEAGLFLPPPRGSSTRRNRVDDLEEMMMMEAIRLSLAAEEERRKKEEKDAKKQAKKEQKESKKAEKTARKSSLFTINSNTSGPEQSAPMERSTSNNSSLELDDAPGKGKGIERIPSNEHLHQASSTATDSSVLGSQESLATAGLQIPSASEPFKRSHLRQMSNASSASSSFAEPGAFPGSNTPPGSAGTEPMFNFRSLTAMISEDEKRDDSSHVEHANGSIGRQGSFEDLDTSSPLAQPPLNHVEVDKVESESPVAVAGKSPAFSIEKRNGDENQNLPKQAT